MPGFGSWKEAFDLDFSSLPTQGPFSPDAGPGPGGSYVIDGFEFFKNNSVNEVAPLTLINGQGLIWQPTAATDYDPYGMPVDTAPRLWLPIYQFIPAAALQWDTSLRIWTYWSADNITAQEDAEIFGLDNHNVAAPFGTFSKRGMLIGGVGGQVSVNNQGAPAPIDPTTQVMMLEIEALASTEGIIYTAPASGPDVWPDLNTMQPRAGVANGNQYDWLVAPAGSNLGILLACQRNGSPTNLSCTLARLRVDYNAPA